MEIIQRVLTNAKNPYKVLSAAGTDGEAFGPETPTSDLRKAYLRLALLLHPDKHKGSKDATDAFQILIRSYESVASGPPQQVPSKAKKPATPKEPKTKKKPAPKQEKRSAKKKKKGSDDDDSDSDSENSDDDYDVDEDDDSNDSEDDDSDSDDDKPLSAVRSKAIQKSSNNNNLVVPVARSNDGCYRTPVRCPRCGPKSPNITFDNNSIYTMFMSQGYKIHCEGCLLEFGALTALHSCPLCGRDADYDPKSYNEKTRCTGCRGLYGYAWYAVSSAALEVLNRRKLEEDAKTNEKHQREERAKKRGGGGEDDEEEEKILMLVGQCIMDEQCPMCKKGVRSGHRAHVEKCLASGGGSSDAPKKRSRSSLPTIVQDRGSSAPRKKRTSKPAAKKSPSKSKSITAKKTSD
eukprot:PhF_6_TR36063/c0_g1_i1/m.52349